MSPEQALGERLIDHRADIWALGVILYECLSGARPVEGENAARMMVRLLSTGIIPIDRLVPSMPRELADVVTRMLSRDAERRPSDLQEVAAVLTPLAGRKAPSFDAPIEPTAPPIEANASPLRGSRIAWGSKTPTGPKPAVKWPARARVAGVALVAALGIGIWAARDGLRSASVAPASGGGIAPAAPATTSRTISSAGFGMQPEAPSVPSAQTDRPAALPSGTEKVAEPASHPRLIPKAAPRGEASAAKSPAPAPGLAAGAACERSSECASRLCLAFSCQ
jgi:serine/threonine-protein kinase